MRTIHTLLFLATFLAMTVARELPRAAAAATVPSTTDHAAGLAPAGLPAGQAGLPAGQAGFEENKGQVRTTSGDAAPYVRYRLAQGNTQLFLLNDGIAYQFSRMHYPTGYADLMATAHHDSKQQEQLEALRGQVRMETYRMNMHLDGASPAARISTEGRSTDYTQYYTHDALDVHTYTKVIYHEVYPGIDWVVYTTEQGMKYDFVVRPGADPNAIRLRFEHHEELEVNAKSELIHGNRMGRFTEERPVSFQDGKEIATRFVLEGNVLHFALEGYDRSRTLTIDPARIWATYYGGPLREFGNSTTTDGSGNVYMAGTSRSTSGIAANGHQNTSGGGVAEDAFLVKFDSEGQRLWATYYGGEGSDAGMDCATDPSGNVFLVGDTRSESGIASGGHQNTIGGETDAFLVKFNAAGVRLWGTYYGGDFIDGGNACAVDATGQVYLAGGTFSYSGIHQDPSPSENVIQWFHGATVDGVAEGYDEDAFLAKFDADGNRLWGTYFGGVAFEGEQGFDRAHACAVDANGNVILAGSSYSSSWNGTFPTGGHQSDPAGQSDAFVLKLTPMGALQWATFYGGSGVDDGRSCTVDPSGNVFLAGATASAAGIASGGHQAVLDGTWDAFLVKFNSAGTRLWGTYYGGSMHDQGMACTVDGNDHVFLAGSTYSASNIAEDGFQNTLNGAGPDGFLAKFTSAGARVWGTYYGGDAFEDVGGCTVDAQGDVYVAGRTISTTNIADGGHQNTHGGGVGNDAYDAFLAKFEASAAEPECNTVGTLQEAEPNNGHSTANALAASTTISGSIGACEPTDNTLDFFVINPTSQGKLRVDACIATTGSAPYDVMFTVRVPSGGTVATYTLPAGTNGVSLASSFEFPCQGATTYFIALEAPGMTDCLSYAFSYQMVAPVFGNDPFPTPSVAHDTYQDGQNAFYQQASTYDLFRIEPPFDGRLTIEVQAEHAGPADGTMEVRLYTTAGTVIEEWIVPTGANGEPITTTVSTGCLGNAADYDVRFYALDCGTSYRWKYTMAPPVFAADAEGPMIAVPYDTFQDGHVGFVSDNSDTYTTAPTLEGVMHFEIQAEHAGDTPGTMEFRFQYSGVWIVQEFIPVGANGEPVTTIIDVPCRGASSHTVVFEDPVACGVSYRWRYYTTEPVFANDAEPNNSTPVAIVLPPSTDATGHLQFYGGVDNGGDNVDMYRINMPVDGVLHVNVEAEHVDASATETLEAVIMVSTGTVLATWEAPVGANSVPTSASFSLPCRGTTIPYYLRLVSGTCGVSYRVSWSVSPAYYAADPEPNNSYAAGIPLDLSNGWHDGHIGFYNTTDDDHYRFTHTGGDFSVTVSAEHVGAGEGTLTLTVMHSTGTTYGTFNAPVGGSSTPITSTFTVADLPASNFYTLYLSDVTCGVSYRLHCATDADEDGVCDAADACPGGPEPGSPCDDGDPLTVDDVITAECACEGDFSTDIADADTAGDLRLWPNPAMNAVWLQVDHARGAAVTVLVRDLTGRLVIAQASLQTNAQGQLLIDLSALTPGTYVIEVQANGQRWSRRVVKA